MCVFLFDACNTITDILKTITEVKKIELKMGLFLGEDTMTSLIGDIRLSRSIFSLGMSYVWAVYSGLDRWCDQQV